MLGISSDSKDTTTPKCGCTSLSNCQIGICECLSYCKDHKDTYSRIKAAGFTKTAFLTFNPKPLTEGAFNFRIETDYEVFNNFFKDYIRDNFNIIDYILCAELTKKGQMHFHMYFSFKNKVTVIKQMVQPMYFAGNILILYGTQPKMGIHYLFKESETMQEYFNEEPFFISPP